ncbi:hypothetical protein PHMEG_00015419 [Phytophthora megakarya]|uniref:Selenoprotein F n=1 Tax=Phytophthora megakarya TaxID=4795 RepID=A0A225W1B4_9STRA|nr:hypothetical protein PHMEG_00015419 [Phytophthora megakarya]
MRLATLSLLFAASVAAQEAPEASIEASSASAASSERLERCATLGFDVEALDCRLCDELGSFLAAKTSKKTKLEAVESVTTDCGDCCSDFSKLVELEGRRYAQATLAVSPQRLKRYPKVANFVEHQAKQIERLQVEETHSRLPMLQFFDENGDKQEEISVAHWDEDSIAEFIEKKLLPEEKEEVVEVQVEAGP